MPFGAEVLPQEGVRFRLWAPGARRVDLCVSAPEGGEIILPMEEQPGGWFHLNTPTAGPGTLYRFCIDEDFRVPDPASRYQPDDVHGPSEVVEPRAFVWGDVNWKGRPWEETVLYELHVGTFTPEGTFAAACSRLKYLRDLGITAIELMPVADFPGRRNWGYDGVYPFAPDSRYGRPEDLKALIQTAHEMNLMVFLDVVYNHFGPEGNYLHLYAKCFFTDRHHTPWGAAINFDGEKSRTVRDFFIHNAIYWLEEFHLDGLRLDSVHAIWDQSRPHILEELAEVVAQGPGGRRHVHLVLENDKNEAHYLKRKAAGMPKWYVAQWNDDIHHALHCLVTGESTGYYADYAADPARYLGRCLTEGFAYQGEPSAYRNGAPRGEPSRHLSPAAFVSFLQNHDQAGNRAFGERITHLASERAIRAAAALVLLAPSPPLLFMGEEFGSRQPFYFFCDFGPDLAPQVTEGRRKEFAKFPAFRNSEVRQRIPDPNNPETFQSAILDWVCLEHPEHRQWLEFYHGLLALRAREIVPRLQATSGAKGNFRLISPRALSVHWVLGDGSELMLLANLGDSDVADVEKPEGALLFESEDRVVRELGGGHMPAWSVALFLQPKRSWNERRA